MGLKNLLTGILLAGSSLVYGQNSNDNSKKISDLYGKKGERIIYKDYSQIPWEQIDTNEIKVKNLESVLVKPIIENKDAFRDSVFAEAEKLGYTKEQIEKLNPKEAVDLAADIIASRYQYDFTCIDESINDKCGNYYKKTDSSFFSKLGICINYCRSFIGVFDLIKKENKNLKNLYVKEAKGLGHMWNQLIFLTKDSMFISDIDITNYDFNHLNKNKLEVRYFDSEIEPKIKALKPLYEYDSELLNNLRLEK